MRVLSRRRLKVTVVITDALVVRGDALLQIFTFLRLFLHFIVLPEAEVFTRLVRCGDSWLVKILARESESCHVATQGTEAVAIALVPG